MRLSDVIDSHLNRTDEYVSFSTHVEVVMYMLGHRQHSVEEKIIIVKVSQLKTGLTSVLALSAAASMESSVLYLESVSNALGYIFRS